MDRQNVTISIRRDLLKQARHMAVESGTSLSGLLSEYLERIVGGEENRKRTEVRISKRLKTGLDLGTKGQRGWTREDLHERR